MFELENAARTDLTTAQARSRVANARQHGLPEDLIQLYKANLACANIDNKIRIELREAQLDPVHVGHLVGLLMSSSGIDGATVGVVEKLVRDAAERAS
ncbi:hypothetical protein [Pimelobacter simplex]|uniref:hypothetical protein n=1 Tax=Nocardioides simplex TaxID=2045 RepID=UPI003AAEB00A